MENKKKEIEQFNRECRLLAKKINEMTASEYEKFIISTTQKLALREMQIRDMKNKSWETEQKITVPILTNRQIATILGAHMLAVSALMGLQTSAMIPKGTFDRDLLIASGMFTGMSMGLKTGIIHYMHIDQQAAENIFNKCKLYLLQNKMQKLQTKQAEELENLKNCARYSNNHVCTAKVSNAATEIISNIEQFKQQIDSDERE